MKEFNNRAKADKYAEYITGRELRKYVAEKVKAYAGESITVFDGACGSGQLEQFVDPSFVYGVEVQQEAVETFRENYQKSEIECKSFFLYDGEALADCAVMNPPFSLKFKDLSDEEKRAIQSEFEWKKSGVVDDIFILKSLKHSRRWGIYIVFPGIAYRAAEKQLRNEIGSNLAELSEVRSGFEDTGINVLLIVIDKEKTTNTVYKEIYDCKTETVLHSETSEAPDDMWLAPREPIVKEVINIDELEQEIYRAKMKRRTLEDELDRFIKDEVRPMIERRR